MMKRRRKKKGTNRGEYYLHFRNLLIIFRCMDLERWINIEGPKCLEESLRKLKLTKESVKRKDFSSYNEDEITQEKKNVKNELKHYDSGFITIFARAPARADKEPMRPLYMYYQNLRKAISKKQYALGGKAKQGIANDSRGSIGSYVSSTGGSNSSRVSIDSPATAEDSKRIGNEKVPFSEEEAKNLPVKDLMKKMNFDGEKDLKKRIHDFMKERKHLRKVLDTFQKDFQKTYNRKLRFTKDISPVASEFKRYKELKKEISKLEIILNRIKKKE
jgi:hypothetical protein